MIICTSSLLVGSAMAEIDSNAARCPLRPASRQDSHLACCSKRSVGPSRLACCNTKPHSNYLRRGLRNCGLRRHVHEGGCSPKGSPEASTVQVRELGRWSCRRLERSFGACRIGQLVQRPARRPLAFFMKAYAVVAVLSFGQGHRRRA